MSFIAGEIDFDHLTAERRSTRRQILAPELCSSSSR